MVGYVRPHVADTTPGHPNRRDALLDRALGFGCLVLVVLGFLIAVALCLLVISLVADIRE